MRFLPAFSLACCLAGPSLGQSPPSTARVSPPVATAPGVTPVAYKLTWDDGNITLARSCERSGRYYRVDDLRASVTMHPIATIVSIVPLEAARFAEEKARLEAAKDAEWEARSEARTRGRSSARVEARTSARTANRVPEPEPEPEPATESAPPAAETIRNPITPYVAPRSGSTATGIPTHVGPRGGVYHYSKNGNKVYQKRK